jgi:uncharacterized membrane protein YagU involved in acid resistance
MRLYTCIIKAGLIAGTLDILAAITNYYIITGKTPEGVFKFIASGAFGSSAFTGGTEMIVAGILFHYLIAFGFTILFFLIYPKLKQRLSSYIILTGLVYGVIAWCIMNLVVIPISRTPTLKPDTTQTIIAMLFLMFFIGLPVAIITRKHYSNTKF